MMSLRKTAGARASSAWLEHHRLDATANPNWYVEITIPADAPDTRFELNIYPEEWGYVFRCGARVSSIRVTDVAFVHGLDDHKLLPATPALDGIGGLMVALERRDELKLQRDRAIVHSNVAGAAAAVRRWLET